MKLTIIGLFLGMVLNVAYTLLKTHRGVSKIQLVIYLIAVVTILFGFDVFLTSLAEYENKAATMGLIFFTFFGLLLFVFAWNWDTIRKRLTRNEKNNTAKDITQDIAS